MTSTPTNDDVFISLLALDAYMRGANEGIANLPDQIGTANRKQLFGESLTAGLQPSASSVGFGATAYEWNGKTVISYRGTDFGTGNWVDTAKDIFSGWIIGFGETTSPSVSPVDIATQAFYAEKYFEDITGDTVFASPNTDVIVTGHSLGGGLAGYIGSLNSAETVLFDHLPFQAAALLRAIEHVPELALQILIDVITGATCRRR